MKGRSVHGIEMGCLVWGGKKPKQPVVSEGEPGRGGAVVIFRKYVFHSYSGGQRIPNHSHITPETLLHRVDVQHSSPGVQG